ncbi:MAG: GHKL domain-containing protein [Bacteroidetes bacterium]|nr:GHKL domain-containing protein [Bacteroidota bacterium]MCB0842725.1 GHKL domain-containing protein [Bacteroidota bacterium]MCB0854295.1 GHKL domain-containing protein [Bacteroidota bacterium]
MIFRRFRINVVIRVILLAAALFVFEFVWEQENWPMTKIFFGLAILGLVLELIRYVEKTNRDLQSFLLAIKHKDFTQSFTAEKRGKSFNDLKDAFNQIIKGYQDLRAEKESHYQYLQNVIEHVSVALICYGKDGQIMLMNQAAKDMLDRPYMSNVQIMERVSQPLLDAVEKIQSGERTLVKTVINDNLKHLSLQATEFKLQHNEYKLVSFQDIRNELDANEVETWQKLIRVLTHEIMNSVTPIISLTKVISMLMTNEKGNRVDLCEIDTEDADDMLDSIKTIESRSKGLLHFVHAYRSLTKIQKPNFREVRITEMLKRVQTLLKPELKKRNIEIIELISDPNLSIQADPELIEQVLINLVKNAMEAVTGQSNPRIEIGSEITHDHIQIFVRDNGPGINEEYLDKIFIPFFTTKKSGSGIGLSLSRQIMRMHRGRINFHTSAEDGTTFILAF